MGRVAPAAGVAACTQQIEYIDKHMIKVPLYRGRKNILLKADKTVSPYLEFYVVERDEAMPDITSSVSLRIGGGLEAMVDATASDRVWLRMPEAVIPYRLSDLFLRCLREEVRAALAIDASEMPGSAFSVNTSDTGKSTVKAVTDYDTVHAVALTLGSVASLGVSAVFLHHMAKLMRCRRAGMDDSLVCMRDRKPDCVFGNVGAYADRAAAALGRDPSKVDKCPGNSVEGCLDWLSDTFYRVDKPDDFDMESPMDYRESTDAREVTMLDGAEPTGAIVGVLPVTFVNAVGGNVCQMSDAVMKAQALLPYVINLLAVFKRATNHGRADIGVCAVADNSRLLPSILINEDL